ncbi:MAG TPA: hypothetical protein VE596_16255 [Gaiellaceae bacterium]|jgi:hypothetical protein|nr:hypothetical protein [Gaiellaceae bacterium]
MLTADLSPAAANDGETLTCRIDGLPDFGGCAAQIDIRGTSEIVTRWVATVPGAVDQQGVFKVDWSLTVGEETLLELARLRVITPSGERVWDQPGALPVAQALLNGEIANPSAEDLQRRKQELEAAQAARYETAIGPGGAGAPTFRVVSVIERLLLRTPLRLPGVQLIPTSTGSSGADEAALLNHLLERLDFHEPMDTEWWQKQSSSNRPWSLIVMPHVKAANIDLAFDFAASERNRILDLLALNRLARGRPIATVIEDVLSGEVRVYHEDQIYLGNLHGGLAAGEDQHTLLAQNAATVADALLAVLLDLLAQAVAEPDIDAAFFRYWSIIEVLSGARLPSGTPVTRLDGTPWPGNHNTTTYAAPRVYELLKTDFTLANETTSLAPAANLYEAVRCWYARRNATVHYGAFVVSDPLQQSHPWYANALLTTMQGAELDWLRALRDTVRVAISGELNRLGGPLVQ